MGGTDCARIGPKYAGTERDCFSSKSIFKRRWKPRNRLPSGWEPTHNFPPALSDTCRLQDYCEGGEREHLLEEIATLRDQLIEVLDAKARNDPDIRSSISRVRTADAIHGNGSLYLITSKLVMTIQFAVPVTV